MASRSVSQQSAAAELLIVEPKLQHTHTFILLHGLRSNGDKFGTELLISGLSSVSKGLAELIPGAKFVFPTAPRSRSTVFKRAKTNQWFDIASLEDPSKKRERQIEGLSETATSIRAVMKEELKAIPAENIVLGGMSQVSAAALTALVTLEIKIGGFIQLSGWLPFDIDIDEIIHNNSEVVDGIMFASEDKEVDENKESCVRMRPTSQ